MNKYREAKKHALDAVRLDPYNDEAFYLLANIYQHQEKWESALNAYFKAIEIEDNREEYYLGLAKMYIKLNEPNKAERYFDEMLQLEPSEEYFYEDYLKFLILNQKFAKGLKVIKQSEENVYSPEILYLKIICLIGMNKKSRALALLDIALEESFEKHTLLAEYMPESTQDEAIQSVIRYYQK